MRWFAGARSSSARAADLGGVGEGAADGLFDLVVDLVAVFVDQDLVRAELGFEELVLRGIGGRAVHRIEVGENAEVGAVEEGREEAVVSPVVAGAVFERFVGERGEVLRGGEDGWGGYCVAGHVFPPCEYGWVAALDDGRAVVVL